MHYLVVAACFKDESPYLREWLEFHLLAGVEHFFLYDNASSDGGDQVVRPYVERGLATLFHTDMDNCQLACYYHTLSAFWDQSRWMAFIDLDEFLFCPDGRDVRTLLQEFEAFPCLGAGWSIFGSSGHRTRPDGLVIENYLHCASRTFEDNRHIKSIVNPLCTLCPTGTSHDFVHYHSASPAVDENRLPLAGPFRGPDAPWSVDRIRINHYLTKSYEEWRGKVKKGRADMRADNPDYVRSHEHFAKYDRNEVFDTTILRYLPALKGRL